MSNLVSDLRALRDRLQRDVEEAQRTALEHHQYWVNLVATGPDTLALDQRDTIALARRREAHYLAVAQALTHAIMGIDAVLERPRKPASERAETERRAAWDLVTDVSEPPVH